MSTPSPIGAAASALAFSVVSVAGQYPGDANFAGAAFGAGHGGDSSAAENIGRRGWTSRTLPATLAATNATHPTAMPEPTPEPPIANMQNLINQIATAKPNTIITGSATGASETPPE